VKRIILLIITLVIRLLPLHSRDRGLEQLISNGGRFKPAFAERDKEADKDRSPRNLVKPV
jgi:hypothetical protein